MTTSTDSLIISQKKLKLILGGLGVALPTILYLGNWWVYGDMDLLASMSGYYYSNMRDIFVGIFFSIGVFLIAYEGYQLIDRILSTIAGLFAIIVALAPTAPVGAEKELINNIHLLAAAGFAFVLMIFSFFLFTKTSPEIPITRRKRIRNLIYRICGILIFGSLVLLITTEMGYLSSPFQNTTFWLEYISNTAFGIAWIVKAEGIFLINDDPILEMNPWEILGIIILTALVLGSMVMLGSIAFF